MTETLSSGAASRRTFLAAGLVAPAAAALVPGSAQAQTSAPGGVRHALKIGTVTYNIAKDWDVPTIIKNCESTGFEAVELRTTHKHGVEPTLSAAERSEVKKRFADVGVIATFSKTPQDFKDYIVEEAKKWEAVIRGVNARPD